MLIYCSVRILLSKYVRVIITIILGSSFFSNRIRLSGSISHNGFGGGRQALRLAIPLNVGLTGVIESGMLGVGVRNVKNRIVY